jgi:hypothetical protein
MSSSKELIKRLQTVSEALRRAAKWKGSGLAVDLGSAEGNFLFELHCFFSCAVDASQSFSLSVGGNTIRVGRGLKARWPRGPGLKVNFSYFILRNAVSGVSVFQLCPGVNVTDKFGKERSPDISLQKPGAGSNPTFNDLHSLWDAKYTIRPTRPLSDVAVSDFIYTVEAFGRPSPPAVWKAGVKNLSNTSGRPWTRSGLITNGQHSTEPILALQHFGVGETWGFPDAPCHRP